MNKTIAYDRESRDFAMYLDGELVGYARSYHEAEVTLDELVYELLRGGLVGEAEPVCASCGDAGSALCQACIESGERAA